MPTVYPRFAECGNDTTWADHAARPANPNHGSRGFNEETCQIEVYNAIDQKWYTTTSMLIVDFYPTA